MPQPVLLCLPHERVAQELGPGEPLPGVLAEKALQEGPQVGRDVGGVLHRVLDDVVDEGVDGVGVERRLSHQELVEDDPEGPKVHCEVVRLLFDQLGRHVEGRALYAREDDRVGGHG
ncbi:unnamed protein product, partial [Ectocarpus fasciculatus]